MTIPNRDAENATAWAFREVIKSFSDLAWKLDEALSAERKLDGGYRIGLHDKSKAAAIPQLALNAAQALRLLTNAQETLGYLGILGPVDPAPFEAIEQAVHAHTLRRAEEKASQLGDVS